MPNTLINPLFHWTQLELKRYFNIDAILQPNNAIEIYNKANSVLEEKTPAQLLEQMNVEVICTTDDPTDSSEYHREIAEGNFKVRVFPSFRPDALFFIGKNSFIPYIKKLSTCVSFEVNNYETLLKAIDERIVFFHENGCRISDYGISGAFSYVEFNTQEVELIFLKGLNGELLSELEIQKFRSSLLLFLGEKYHKNN